MRKLIYSILSMSVLCGPCVAQEEVPEEPKHCSAAFMMLDTAVVETSEGEFTKEELTEEEFAEEAVTEEAVTEEEDEMLTQRAFVCPFQLSDETKSFVVQTLKTVDINGAEIVLSDNSVFKVKWWRSIAKKWTAGDEIVIALHVGNWWYPRLEIVNLTRQERVWSYKSERLPNVCADAVLVKKIFPNGLVSVNRNVAFVLDKAHINTYFKNWAEGDQLVVMLDPNSLDGSIVRVWNISANSSILFNVKVLGFEEMDAILKQ